MSFVAESVLLALYCRMLRIRRAEEKISELFLAGEIQAPVHLSVGQEAVAVGVMSILEKIDAIFSTHRCHAHYLAKGGDMGRMFAELCGKSTGCCRGYGGTMHLSDAGVGIVSSPIVGSAIPLAVGVALSSKLKREEKIAVAFFGDGAVEEGVFWESINFASVHKLPVLFVCENNLYATHAPILKRQPSADIAPRVAPHGIATFTVDGNDVVSVQKTAEIAAAKTRKGEPCFIEAKTYRIKEHWGVGEDWHLGYRSHEEGEYWEKQCPIKRMRTLLEKEGVTQEVFENRAQEIAREIDEAVAFALESPPPAREELMDEKGEV